MATRAAERLQAKQEADNYNEDPLYTTPKIRGSDTGRSAAADLKRAKDAKSSDRLYNANLSQSDENFGPDLRLPSRASRVDNSDGSKVGPNMGKVNKPKAKTSVMVALPKSTTPNMDTTKGTTGSRNSFDAGEVNPFAPKAAAEKLIDYPSRTADAPTPAEVAAIVKAKDESRFSTSNPMGMKKGGKVKCMSSGGSSKASSRGDGCAQRGKTRGRMI